MGHNTIGPAGRRVVTACLSPDYGDFGGFDSLRWRVTIAVEARRCYAASRFP